MKNLIKKQVVKTLLKISDLAKGQTRLIGYYDDGVTPSIEYLYRDGKLLKEVHYRKNGNPDFIYIWSGKIKVEEVRFHKNSMIKSIEIKDLYGSKPTFFEWDKNGFCICSAPRGSDLSEKDCLKIANFDAKRI